MKFTKLLFLFAMPLVCLFTTNANAYIEKQNAVVLIMSKAAGKVQSITLPVGKIVDFEKLSVQVNTCKQTDPFQPEDFFMFVQIDKKPEGKIFSGWMSRNEPGDNPLQNADYDLWLLRCE